MTRLLLGAPVLVGLGLIALLLHRYGLGEIGQALRNLSVPDLLLYVALTGAVVLGYALRWQLVTRSLGRRLTLAATASARLAGDAVSNLVPSARLAGEPVRAAIAHAHGIDATTATAGVALDRLLETITNIVCALLYVSVFSATHTFAAGSSLGVLTMTLAAGATALAVPFVLLWRDIPPLWPIYALLAGRGERAQQWTDVLRRTEEHLLRLFRERPVVFLQGLALAFATEALTICEFHFLLASFGVDVDLPTLLLVLVGTGVAHAVPMPAALGTLEGSQVAVFAVAAGDPSLGFAVGLIVRLHETLLSVVGLVCLSANGISLARLPVFRPRGEVSA